MNEDFLFDMETFFMALADKTRLRLLNLMRAGEVCVGFFTEVLNESQPKVSRHLAYLRSAGVVKNRRDGKWMYYRLVKPESDFAAAVLHDTLGWLESQEDMRKDYEKLSLVSSLPTASETIIPAPQSDTYAKANIKSAKKEELEIFLL